MFDMAEYRFKVGDLVRVQIGSVPNVGGALIDATYSRAVDGVYKVSRLMPSLVTGEPRYQIKGCYGQAGRNVEQSFLTPARLFSQPRY